MSQNSLDFGNNDSTVFEHKFTPRVWHESQSRIPSNNDLSKSVIKKIPGPKHSMSQHLQVMLLFQAAQIQRLTENLQILRNYKIQMQKGPMNLHSMQIQIKQLTDEIFRKQRQIAILRQKYDAALKNLSQFDMANKDLQRKLRQKLIEVKSLRQQLQQRDLTVSQSIKVTDQKEIQIKKLNDSIFFISKEKDQLEEKNDQYLDKLALLSQEMVRLRQSNAKMRANKSTIDGEINVLRQQNYQLKQALQQLRQQNHHTHEENHQLHTVTITLQQQIQQFKSRINQLQSIQQHSQTEFKNQLLKLQHNNDQLVSQNNRFKQQIVQNNNVVGQKQHLVEELSRRLDRGKEEMMILKQQIGKLQNQLKLQQNQLKKQQQVYTELLAHARELEYDLQSSKTYHFQEKSQIQSIARQNQYSKQSQLRQLKFQNESLKKEISRVSGILEKLAQEKTGLNTTFNTSIEGLNSQLRQKQSIIKKKQQQINQLQKSIQQITQTRKKTQQATQHQIQQLTKSLVQHKNLNQRFNIEINRLTTEKQSMLKELSTKQLTQSSISIRYQTLMNEIEAKNQKINEFRSIIEEKEIRLERLQSEIGYKNDEMRRLRVDIQKLQNDIRNKQKQLQQANHQILDYEKTFSNKQNRLLTDLREIQNKLQQKQRQIINYKDRQMKLQNQLSMVTHELERLNFMIIEKDNTIKQSQRELSERQKSYAVQIGVLNTKLQQQQALLASNQQHLKQSMQAAQHKHLTSQLSFQLSQMRQSLHSKSQQLIRCNEYILSLNQRMNELSNQQMKVIKILQTTSIHSSNYFVSNTEVIKKLVEQLKMYRNQCVENEKLIMGKLDENKVQIIQRNQQLQEKRQTTISNSLTNHFQQITQLLISHRNQNNQQKPQQISNLQHLIDNSQQQQHRQMTIIQQRLQQLRNQNINQSKYLQLINQINSLRTDNLSIKTMLSSYINSMNIDIGEIDRLKEQVANKLKTIQQYQMKNNMLQQKNLNLSIKIGEVEHEINQLMNQINRLTKSYDQLINERNNIIQKQTKLTKQYQRLVKQQSEITLETDRITAQLKTIKQENHQLLEDNNKLIQLNSQLQRQVKHFQIHQQQISQLIEHKQQEIKHFHHLIKKNHQEYLEQLQKNNKQLKDKHDELLNQNSLLRQEIARYDKVLKVREQQQRENQKILIAMGDRITELGKNNSNQQKEINRLGKLNKHVHDLQLQLQTIMQERQQEKRQYSSMMMIASEQEIYDQINPLKKTIIELQNMNYSLHARLQHALSKLSTLSKSLAKIQSNETQNIHQRQSLADIQAKYEQSLRQVQNLQKEKSQMQIELMKYQGRVKQLQLQKEYHNHQIGDQVSRLQKQMKLISKDNHILRQQNSFIKLQLKKANLSQQKMRVLNQQIDRLALERIDMDSELTNYKLQLSQESILERRQQQQLCLMVLLFAEVQSLRTRLKQEMDEKKTLLAQQRYRF